MKVHNNTGGIKSKAQVKIENNVVKPLETAVNAFPKSGNAFVINKLIGDTTI